MGPLSYLVLAAYDSMNQPTAALVQELHARGLRVVVVGNTSDSASMAAFKGCGVPPIDVKRFDTATLSEFDVAVLPPVSVVGLGPLVRAIRERGLFTVSFATLFFSIVMREYTHLVLAVGEAKFSEFRENGLAYPMIAVGNPQYDCLVQARREELDAVCTNAADAAGAAGTMRRVLIVDQGGYPYGQRGRRELANTLCAIASFNPEMEFCIKPRHYAVHGGRKTHEQMGTILEFAESVPSNLLCMSKPAELEELLQEFDGVITMWSTAHLDAALYNVPLILIGGLHTEDVFDVRVQRVDAAYERLQATGCVHDFRELQTKRVAFSYVAPRYIKREVYRANELAAPRAIAAIERAWEVCTQGAPDSLDAHSEHGMPVVRLWRRPFQITFDEFMHTAANLVNGEANSDCTAVQQNYLVRFNALVQEWAYTNRCLGQPIAMHEFCAYFERTVVSTAECEAVLVEAQTRWQELYNDCFSCPATLDAAGTNAVVQDFYFDWLYEQGRYEQLMQYAGTVHAPDSLAYNRARAALVTNNTKQAFAFLQEFLHEVTRASEVPRRKAKHAVVLMKPFMKGRFLGAFIRFLFRRHNTGKLVALAKQAAGVNSTVALARYAVKALPDFVRK